jgi:DUF4097 and DUF4098 domain-containing protein YvlB
MKNSITKAILFSVVTACSSLSFAATCTKVMNNNVVNGNLNVPENAVCVLNGSVINGDINAGKNSSLTVNSATIQGDVTAQNSKAVKLDKATVNGDVKLNQIASSIVIDKSVINGDLTCAGNIKSTGGMNVVRGDVQGKCK